MIKASTTPSGALGIQVMRKKDVEQKLKYKRWWMETCLYFRVLRNALLRPFGDAVSPEARLFAKLIRANGSQEDFGLVCTKAVTTVGVAYLVDAFQGIGGAEPENFKYHDSGINTGATAEAASNTVMDTAVESRQAGSPSEGATDNIYKNQATIVYSGTYAIVEHGLFSAITGGTLLDRSVFPAINVANGDSILFTYELTLPSGS